MANDVTNILENMKLTTDEKEVISISDEGRKEEVESCSQSLIGKFLTEKIVHTRKEKRMNDQTKQAVESRRRLTTIRPIETRSK